MAEIIGNQNDDFLIGTPTPDRIFGASGNDTILAQAGDDFIDGGAGNDGIDADLGDDIVSGDGGNDTLFGYEGNDLLNGGNDNDRLLGWSGNDTLFGGNGDDSLDGQAGTDSLYGEAGNDTYVLSDRLDSLVEAPDSGIDSVLSAFPFSLPRDFENLTLVGDRSLTGRGNSADNILRGNDARNRLLGFGGSDRLVGFGGNDILIGGDGSDELVGSRGRDSLTGGAGRDRFDFESRGQGRDRITDFNSDQDTIGISRRGFGGRLNRGTLSTDRFHVGSGASDRDDRFIYDSDRGALYFDPDGSGGARQILIASLDRNLSLTRQNIVVLS